MRPTRLELEGFTAFRERAEVEFDGADLFSLTGPTGSGKTSLLDAICFALYGSVPRYGDRRLVAPVISQGRMEARVRFDFTVLDVPYTAVRVVRRTDGGATTKEARLESPGREPVGGAAEVTQAVERLLGLSFEHFTKSVVLPQGDFARFLHDRPGDRQELLRELLDLDAYRRMMQAANQRGASAEGRLGLLTERLEALASATPDARRAVAERLTALEALRTEVEAAREELEGLAESARRAEEEAAELAGRAALAGELAIPDGVAELAGRLEAARDAARRAEQEEAAARQGTAEAEAALEALPEAAPATAAVEAGRRRETLERQLRDAEEAVAGAVRGGSPAARALDEAEAARRAARAALEELDRDHAAHRLASGLQPGSPCPVCGREVEEAPVVETPPALQEAVARVDAAEGERARAEAEHRRAEGERIKAETRAEELRSAMAALEEDSSRLPSPDEAKAILAGRETAQRALAEAREAERLASQALEAARGRLGGLEGAERSAWRRLDEARDRLAALSPPASERLDLREDWERLAAWAGARREELERASVEARSRAETATERRRAREAELTAAARRAGVEPEGGRDLWESCVARVTEARAELERIDQAMEEAERHRKEQGELREELAVARELARHLSARGFEKWVLDEALEVLVEGANGILAELSEARYALALDGQANFAVVDRLNADEVRPAKTLSGGETFLASLALALSLADRLAEMAGQGGVRLESIFLDEGFGTLDPETLETVASVIHELGSSGRTVGLVTHVRELAEQVPVRFEVRRGPGGAAVDRVPPLDREGQP